MSVLQSELEVQGSTWLTANIRPAGRFGRSDVDKLRGLLDAVSTSASMVVLDLQATELRTSAAVRAIDDAAEHLERRGGCLLCTNADDDTAARLASCRHAVVVARGLPGADPRRAAGAAALAAPGR